MPVRPLLLISPRDFSDRCRIRATTRTLPFTAAQPTMAAAESRLETQTAIDAHVERLRRHLRKRLASEEDVSDIAQEACLKLLQAPHPESIDNPRAYLFRIAQHLTYRHYRHHRHHHQIWPTPWHHQLQLQPWWWVHIVHSC